ncbi:MAG: hypothetical protein HYS12_24765 [Planctomycetes bacterium]|nr:hypothetical protein [Planctomycetota bacterium]
MRIVLLIAMLGSLVLFTGSGAAFGPDQNRRSLADEVNRLTGTWRSGEGVKVEVEMKFRPAKDGKLVVSQTWKKFGAQSVVSGVKCEAKEIDGARYLFYPKPDPLSIGRYPLKIEFQFEKEELILKVPYGHWAGTHRLSKAKNK